jgi:nitrogen fixation/metabolism regulation signal transduction histidine kinase
MDSNSDNIQENLNPEFPSVKEVVAKIPTMVIILNQDQTIHSTSPSATRLLQSYSPHGALPAKFEELLKPVFERGETFDSTKKEVPPLELTLEKGGLRRFQVSASPLSGPDEIICGAVLTLNDVTRPAPQSSSGEEPGKSLKHDLKAPLASISMALGLSLDGSFGELPEPQRQLYEGAMNECRRLVEIINSL